MLDAKIIVSSSHWFNDSSSSYVKKGRS